jgi:hypothetical protein
MFNRLLGIVFTLVALTIIAFAVLNFGNYSSMVFNKVSQDAACEILAEEAVEAEEVVVEADSLEITEIVAPGSEAEPAAEELMDEELEPML